MARLVVRQFAWQRLMQRVPATTAGAALFAKYLHHVDRFLMSISRDRWSVPGLLTGLPVVIVKTSGAKSGKPRVTPTIGVPDGDNIVLIASNWGQKTHPAWYYNLLKRPETELEFNGCTGIYIAHEVVDEAEYDRLWRMAVDMYMGYEKYRARVGGRRIPILSLSPKKGAD